MIDIQSDSNRQIAIIKMKHGNRLMVINDRAY